MFDGIMYGVVDGDVGGGDVLEDEVYLLELIIDFMDRNGW